jgi:putative peptide maturation system protein
MQPGILDDMYDLLRALERERSGPDDALARLARTRRTAELAELDLVWERSAFDGSLHFDALLPSAAGTLSMSWCPDRGTPWPLRGVQRNGDADLVRVDGYTLQVPTAIALLDLVWGDDDLLTRLIDAAIVHKQQRLLGISPSEFTDDQLQHAMDEFRRRNHLLTAQDTERWLAEHGLDQARLESILADKLVRSLVRDRVIAPRVEARLPDVTPFDRVALEWLAADDAAQAHAMFARVRDGETTLAGEAQLRFAAGGPAPELFVRLWRRDLPATVAVSVFGGAPGAVLPPFELGGQHRVARVLAVTPADAADPDIVELSRELCFTEWLAERRHAAEIEWFWGFDAEGG